MNTAGNTVNEIDPLRSEDDVRVSLSVQELADRTSVSRLALPVPKLAALSVSSPAGPTRSGLAGPG